MHLHALQRHLLNLSSHVTEFQHSPPPGKAGLVVQDDGEQMC